MVSEADEGFRVVGQQPHEVLVLYGEDGVL
jgi:hypothetical protein